MSAGQLIRRGLRIPAVGLVLLGLLLARPAGASGPPPVITQQPQSQYAPLLGIVTFSVTATSGTTMTYQWYKNGVAIPGATSSSYTILTVLGSDAGAFNVKVTNAGGSVMSDTAYLNIPPPPTITSQPQSQTVVVGQGASFSVTASSMISMTYQWYFKGAAVAGATGSSYSLSQVTTGNGGNYRVVVANSTGGTTSQVAKLTVAVPPSIHTQPQNLSTTVGQTATFTVGVSGTSPLGYQWHFNGANLPGATAGALVLTNVQTNQAGLYSVTVSNAYGSVDSSNGTLAVFVPPAISTQPVSQTVMVGQSVSFSVVAGGSPTLSYQWRHNGTNIVGETNSMLALNNVQPDYAGDYSVGVGNPYGSAESSSAGLTVNVPPSIDTQPQSQTAIVGQSATFGVAVSGTSPLSYQWSFNGAPLPGATSSALTIPQVDWTNAGTYSVFTTNVAGSATSVDALLTVANPPTLTANVATPTGALTGFTFQVSAPVGYTYVVLASTNLSDWAPIATNVMQSNADLFTDIDSANYPVRFYRVQLQ